MIAPLYGGRTHSEILARLLGDVLPKPEELVRETFRGLVGDAVQRTVWRRTVHDGLLADSAWPAATVSATSREQAGERRSPSRFRRTASWNWSSVATRRSTTAGLPTTAGCRSAPIRSPS